MPTRHIAPRENKKLKHFSETVALPNIASEYADFAATNIIGVRMAVKINHHFTNIASAIAAIGTTSDRKIKEFC